ncbi:RNA polymerase sigma factor [Psychroserpens sp.]|uniref:RNA polymerase sigma factor n=1 Tax=Psychroserpens sp. TaxID=2020870 RepID=UPI003C78CEE2
MDLDKTIKACKRQKLEAQSQLYQHYKDDLYLLCLKYCRNKEEAQDNLQDAFLDIFKNIKRYNGSGSFEGWMKRITINKAIDSFKKQKHVSVELKNDILLDTTIDQTLLNDISLSDILQYIQELPTQYRLVFNLYELDDYSHKQIAKLLGISSNTSKSNLHRAKKLLQKKIQESGFHTPKKLTANGK